MAGILNCSRRADHGVQGWNKSAFLFYIGDRVIHYKSPGQGRELFIIAKLRGDSRCLQGVEL